MLCVPCYDLLCHARILEGLHDLISVEWNRLLGIRIGSNRLRQNFSPPCAFIRDLTSGKSSSAKRTSGESEDFDPRADSNRLCLKTIRLSLGVLDMSGVCSLWSGWTFVKHLHTCYPTKTRLIFTWLYFNCTLWRRPKKNVEGLTSLSKKFNLALEWREFIYLALPCACGHRMSFRSLSPIRVDFNYVIGLILSFYHEW